MGKNHTGETGQNASCSTRDLLRQKATTGVEGMGCRRKPEVARGNAGAPAVAADSAVLGRVCLEGSAVECSASLMQSGQSLTSAVKTQGLASYSLCGLQRNCSAPV